MIKLLDQFIWWVPIKFLAARSFTTFFSLVSLQKLTTYCWWQEITEVDSELCIAFLCVLKKASSSICFGWKEEEASGFLFACPVRTPFLQRRKHSPSCHQLLFLIITVDQTTHLPHTTNCIFSFLSLNIFRLLIDFNIMVMLSGESSWPSNKTDPLQLS